MTTEQRILILFLSVVSMLIAAYDIWAVLYRGRMDTISAAIWQLSTQQPIIPFAAGFLAGHLFWQGK